MKLKHIDSIRGIAILMVILGHVGQEIRGLSFISHLLTSYGQMGVQLFFVASAYTLCLSATNRSGESHPVKKYAIRRFFRIAPVYYLGLIGYFFVAALLEWKKSGLLDFPEKYTILNVLSNVFFVHGFYPPANNNIVPGGWSIGTEMAFYVLFPILFHYAKKWTMGSLNLGLLLLVIVCILSQLLLLLTSYFTGLSVKNNSFMYYNLITQLPVFCIGIGYYVYQNHAFFKANWKFDLVAFLLLTAFALVLWNSNWSHIFSIIPLVSALSFVFLITLFKKIEQLNFKYLTRIGTVSYSMYIIHFVLLNFSGAIASKLTTSINKNIVLLLLYLMTVGVTFLLSIVSEKHIEKPFIEMGRKIIHKLNK